MKRSSHQHILGLTIQNLSELISSKALSPVDLIEATLERIDSLNEQLHAFITVLGESAREDARNAELSIRQGKYIGPLHGIPISLKDLIYVKGVRSTSGSKILANFVPSYDATVVRRLRDAGAIIIGMNNTHEFACGITNINPHYGSSKNPWDPSRMSGGSSGGSAVAVSTGMASGALGTDTSGSTRVPASLCGLFGLKPTYGRVSNYGIMQLAPSLDHVGQIARSTWDTALLLQAVSGYDELDESTVNYPVPDYCRTILENTERPGKLSLGVPSDYFFDLIDPRVMNVFERFLDQIHDSGISTTPVRVTETQKIYESWKAFRLGESAAVHATWLNSRRNEYGNDVLDMLERGTKITAVEYITAQRYKRELQDSFLRAMRGLAGLLIPTTIIDAPSLQEKVVNVDGKDIEVYLALSRLTTAFDVTGLPALNVPAGFTKENLPVGVQIIGRKFDERTLLTIGHIYENSSKICQEMIPPIVRE